MITSDKATGSERFRESASDADGSKVIEAWELVIVAHFSFCNSDIEPVKRTIGFAWLRNHCRKTHGLELILPADKDTKGPVCFRPEVVDLLSSRPLSRRSIGFSDQGSTHIINFGQHPATVRYDSGERLRVWLKF